MDEGYTKSKFLGLMPYTISGCNAPYEGIRSGYYSHFSRGETEVVNREAPIWPQITK